MVPRPAGRLARRTTNDGLRSQLSNLNTELRGRRSIRLEPPLERASNRKDDIGVELPSCLLLIVGVILRYEGPDDLLAPGPEFLNTSV